MSEHNDNQRLIRKPEAARYLGVSEKMVEKMASAGELTPVRLGRAVRFDRVQIDRLIDQRMAEQGA